jgi:PDZ domain-containing protein
VRRPLGRGVRTVIAVAMLASGVGAWWSGVLPCAAVTAQPACQLAVSGGPVLDTGTLLSVSPSGAERAEVVVREPAGRLLVTTIEVWEFDDVRGWWAALRDPHVDLVARARLVPAGGDLDDVAEAGRSRMEESQVRAVGLALATLGLVAGPDVPSWAWPVEVSFATDEVGGPSAGLMLALGVVARLAPIDPTARTEGAASGRPPLRVAGTGALEADGRVIGVGGVEHKLRRAVADARAGGGIGGALDAFLLPVEDLPVARRTDVSRDVLLVPVRDLAAALAALEALATGASPQEAELLAGNEVRAR